MTENPVENPVCPACGAPLRPQALFCYNCGSSIAPAIENAEQPPQQNGEAVSEVRLREEISDHQAETHPTTKLDENHVQPIGKPTETLVEDKPEIKLPAQAETKLKSAASLRRSGRVAPQKKTVEVVWDEPENAPNVWFLVAAFVLALFAVGILLAMLYIR
jgi:hypothetical protein